MFGDDRPRLRVLLDHFGLVEDIREPWRAAHPLPEVLLLVVCGTIGACDDFDATVEWGEDNLPFLRRFLPYHHGIPGARWLRILLNRIDPALFSDCFMSLLLRLHLFAITSRCPDHSESTSGSPRLVSRPVPQDGKIIRAMRCAKAMATTFVFFRISIPAGPAPHQASLDKPARASEQGGEAPRRCRRHLSQRRQHHPPDRSRAA